VRCIHHQGGTPKTKELISRLGRIEAHRVALRTLPERLQELEAVADGLNAHKLDGVKVSGSRSIEAAFAANYEERDRITDKLRSANSELRILETALDSLREDERLVLELFYVHRRKGHVEELQERLNCEASTVYRRKNTALQKLYDRVYGAI